MKKLFLALCLIAGTAVPSKAYDPVVVGTLLDHVTTVTQVASGETRLALLDSVVLIGNRYGHSILDLQVGFSGDTKPEIGEPSGASFLAGGFFKISSLLKDKVHFADHWKFLNALEHGVSYSYDFREKRDYVSYQVGLAFTLNPKE